MKRILLATLCLVSSLALAGPQPVYEPIPNFHVNFQILPVTKTVRVFGTSYQYLSPTGMLGTLTIFNSGTGNANVAFGNSYQQAWDNYTLGALPLAPQTSPYVFKNPGKYIVWDNTNSNTLNAWWRAVIATPQSVSYTSYGNY